MTENTKKIWGKSTTLLSKFTTMLLLLLPLSSKSFGEVDTTVPIFIIGDSTVCNYSQKDARRGWGQMIRKLLKNGESGRVINRARSGASSKSFKPIINKWASPSFWGDGKTLSKYKKIGVKGEIAQTDTSKGGYLFIQFGHNDSFDGRGNKYNPKSKTVPGLGNEFDKELMEYITYAKEHNLTPVLVTPMARMFKKSLNDNYFHRIKNITGAPEPWTDMNGKTGDWPETIRQIGKRENVIVLDLTTKSKDFFASFEKDSDIVKKYSWNKADRTHFNEAGALKMAEFIRDLAKEASPELYQQFKSSED